MRIIRVLLAQMPQILRDILEHAVRHAPDLELMHDAGPAPDVVILGGTATDDARLPAALLRRWPHTRILIVTPTEGEAAIYELHLRTTGLGRVSPAELVETIRMAVQEADPLPATGPPASASS